MCNMVTDNKLYKVAITVDGNYVHGKYYDTLTQVYYAEEDGGDGCSYISVKPNQNVIPGTDDTVWKRSSRSGKGEKGDKGDPGERGPQGEKGDTGEIDEQQLQEIEAQIAAKQDALVSGTNIKTVGGQSILGGGNIQVGDENAVKFVQQSLSSDQKAQARTNIGAVSNNDIPEISTNISTDAFSDMKTASPKAVKDYVDTHHSDPDAVKYTEQSLTPEQKAQARTNISAGTYSKPSGGIPASDLAGGVIPDVSGFYTKPANGIPASDIATGVIPTVPTISTDISTDAASDAKTASPKAVKAYVDGVASAINDDVEDLQISMETIGNGAFVVAWDGESAPVTTDIPVGVSVTYDGDSYAGALDASASTLGKIYLVATGTSGNYDRYITVGDSSYSWIRIGTTAIDLSGYATKSEINQIEEEAIELSIPRVVKNALYTILQNVAFINDNGYSDELLKIHAWAENLVLMSISAAFTQGAASIYETDSLDKLKQYLVVTATFDDSSTTVLSDSDYILSGTLTVGTSTITATCQGKTDTFTVVVSASPYLYILPSTFTSTGSSSIDTGFMPAKSKVYTILCECTETTASSAAVFIYGNRKTASSSGYIGLTTQNGSAWGIGLSYSDRKSIGSNLFRSVATMTIGDSGAASVSLSYKIGSGSTATSSASYNTDITTTANVKNICLGDCIGNSTGFNGTITYFAIYDGEMASTDINYFLNNGA